MRTKMMVALVVMLGLVIGAGCQQQRKPRSAADTKVKGLNRIHFDFDRSDIKSEYKKTLEDNASWLKANRDTKITVEGHCDERGTEEYNMALGHRRASSAKSYLTSLGVDGGRMKTVSYGEERPLETCHNESCWWKNRRAEFMH
ncbi:MAG TPA: peptidoglycan-associated lipoprotein Pal [bacterium]|nr:peptidoglycan-associated lipoprotein Pal [bacterium]